MDLKRTIAAVALLAACESRSPEPAPHDADILQASAEHHWDYGDEAGPEQWGALAPEFAACGSGTHQSPVDLAGSTAADLPDVVFDYRATPARIFHNGHTVQVELDSLNRIVVDGESYDLVQFHYHMPSEHATGGEHADAELHLVHENPNGTRVAVGVLIEEGSENAVIAPFWDDLPVAPAPARPLAEEVHPENLLPSDRTLVWYDGSLTAPPCTEDVRWIVMSEPVEMSSAQLATLKGIIGENRRPIQPLNGRPIERDIS